MKNWVPLYSVGGRINAAVYGGREKIWQSVIKDLKIFKPFIDNLSTKTI